MTKTHQITREGSKLKAVGNSQSALWYKMKEQTSEMSERILLIPEMKQAKNEKHCLEDDWNRFSDGGKRVAVY